MSHSANIQYNNQNVRTFPSGDSPTRTPSSRIQVYFFVLNTRLFVIYYFRLWLSEFFTLWESLYNQSAWELVSYFVCYSY